MNIILSNKEKHPASQAEVCASLDLADKKVLFVFGLANSKGDNKVYVNSGDGLDGAFLRLHNLKEYSYLDEGEDTPELLEPTLKFWERQGFEVAVVGISKNVRRSGDAGLYKLLLQELHSALLG